MQQLLSKAAKVCALCRVHFSAFELSFALCKSAASAARVVVLLASRSAGSENVR